MQVVSLENNFKGQERIIIEDVQPEIDCGKFPIKRVTGERLEVCAKIFADSHDILSAEILYKKQGDEKWVTKPMEFLKNDKWKGSFTVIEKGWYLYTIRAWIDKFKTWQQDIIKKYEAGVEISADLISGITLIRETIEKVMDNKKDILELTQMMSVLGAKSKSMRERIMPVITGELENILNNHPYRLHAYTYEKQLLLICENRKAGFSSWYEFFPRSVWENEEAERGNFKLMKERLKYVADMGFDVVYLPPVHPVGIKNRKGKNNSVRVNPGDPGSPWAIGGEEGGHKAINPELGTFEDFQEFINEAKKYDIDISIDIAFQCSPDHPYVKEHPEWFRKRPDGSIQYAENPPKKYEDIFPFDFESDDWKGLWEELKSVFVFWIQKGIFIFRVDNPHTKSLKFWGWVINEIKKEYPDTIFLSEAFTRPAVMYQLAKQGFTQSYTYFTWRNTKYELTSYFKELTKTSVKDFFRPNTWPNTPDILPEFLQVSGRTGFIQRLVLAATLSSNYGIYGPAFELMDNTPTEWGREEYLNSEKYEIKKWNIESKDSLKNIIKRINHIRKQNPAFHNNYSLKFLQIENDQLIAYTKHTDDFSNIILVVVNLDPYHTHTGWVKFPVKEFEMPEKESYQVRDLFSNTHYLWYGEYNYVEINPGVFPAHIFVVRRKIRTEHDFDYFM